MCSVATKLRKLVFCARLMPFIDVTTGVHDEAKDNRNLEAIQNKFTNEFHVY